MSWLILPEETSGWCNVVVGGDSSKGRQRSLSIEGVANRFEPVLVVCSEALRLESLLVDHRLLSSALDKVDPDFFFAQACELVQSSDALDHMLGIELRVLALDWLDGLRADIGNRRRGVESRCRHAPSGSSQVVIFGIIVEGVVVVAKDAGVGWRICG